MTSQDTPRRHWFQFRLRTLLIFMTLCAIPFAWVSSELAQRRRERPVIQWIEEGGGQVNPTWMEAAREATWWQQRTDSWFGAPVRSAHLTKTNASDLSPLARLKSLERIHLRETPVNDLTPLTGLMNLSTLRLDGMHVSELTSLAGMKNLNFLSTPPQ